jgi:hypothetical protein
MHLLLHFIIVGGHTQTSEAQDIAQARGVFREELCRLSHL